MPHRGFRARANIRAAVWVKPRSVFPWNLPPLRHPHFLGQALATGGNLDIQPGVAEIVVSPAVPLAADHAETLNHECCSYLLFQKLSSVLLKPLLTVFPLLSAPVLAWAGLPPGWSDADIGSPALTGSASDNNGLWTVTGGGSDIWNNADQFNFASTNFTGDGTMTVQVTSLQNSDPSSGWSKAGLMFRNDSTAGSANVCIVATAGQGVSFQWRSTAGGSSDNIAAGGGTAPVWLQLTRLSQQFTGSFSTDGSNWVDFGSETVEMNSTALGGLAVTAHNDSALNMATFTNFSAISTPPPIFGVYRERWTNLNSSLGNTLAMLTNTTYNPNWPNHPAAAYTQVLPGFETEVNDGLDYYGQRLRAFVVPPTNGNYTFWIASDDTSILFLSTDENPADEIPIAAVTSWIPGAISPRKPASNPRRFFCKADNVISWRRCMSRAGAATI